ncbi:MAG: hypothetical protein JXA54_16730 [Candidatus Heimdallarchaeota archaeon]|nr:hypothetical protein [Candidatus Heimdallarchaeota archaeon]
MVRIIYLIRMSNEAKKGSDLGFYIFLILAAILLIPIALGAKNFNQIVRIWKTLLITIGIIAAILVGVLSYYRILKKAKQKNKINGKNPRNERVSQKEEEEIANDEEKGGEYNSIVLPKKPTELSE